MAIMARIATVVTKGTRKPITAVTLPPEWMSGRRIIATVTAATMSFVVFDASFMTLRSKQSTRPSQDHQDQDDEGDGELVARAERANRHRHLLHHPDDQSTHQRPVRATNPAQDRGGEDRQEQDEPQLRLELRLKREQNPCDGDQPAADEPGGAHHRFGVDAA